MVGVVAQTDIKPVDIGRSVVFTVCVLFTAYTFDGYSVEALFECDIPERYVRPVGPLTAAAFCGREGFALDNHVVADEDFFSFRAVAYEYSVKFVELTIEHRLICIVNACGRRNENETYVLDIFFGIYEEIYLNAFGNIAEIARTRPGAVVFDYFGSLFTRNNGIALIGGIFFAFGNHVFRLYFDKRVNVDYESIRLGNFARS